MMACNQIRNPTEKKLTEMSTSIYLFLLYFNIIPLLLISHFSLYHMGASLYVGMFFIETKLLTMSNQKSSCG